MMELSNVSIKKKLKKKKKKKSHWMWQKYSYMCVGTTQCDDGTIKYEKKELGYH